MLKQIILEVITKHFKQRLGMRVYDKLVNNMTGGFHAALDYLHHIFDRNNTIAKLTPNFSNYLLNGHSGVSKETILNEMLSGKLSFFISVGYISNVKRSHEVDDEGNNIYIPMDTDKLVDFSESPRANYNHQLLFVVTFNKKQARKVWKIMHQRNSLHKFSLSSISLSLITTYILPSRRTMKSNSPIYHIKDILNV